MENTHGTPGAALQHCINGHLAASGKDPFRFGEVSTLMLELGGLQTYHPETFERLVSRSAIQLVIDTLQDEVIRIRAVTGEGGSV